MKKPTAGITWLNRLDSLIISLQRCTFSFGNYSFFEMTSLSVQEFTRYVVILCWIFFVVGFLFRKKIHAQTERKRNTLATTGMLLEAIGYALVWFVHREFNASFLPLGVYLESIIAFVAISLAISSVWLILSAIKALGKHWTPAARIIERHELITACPYNLVRHPIYSGMFGLMLATGLAYSKPLALAGAVVAYLVGTFIRIRIEEKLLSEYFGGEYTDYKKKVAAFIPYIL